MKKKYVLTRKAKLLLMQWFRKELEAHSALPIDTVARLQTNSNPRWITLFYRWKREFGRYGHLFAHKSNEDWQKTIRMMWIDLYGALPNAPLPTRTASPAPYPIALSDAEKNDPNSFEVVDAGDPQDDDGQTCDHDDSDDSDDSDDDGDGDSIDESNEEGNSNGEKQAGDGLRDESNGEHKRIQTNWNQKVESLAKTMSRQQNDMPRKTSKGYSQQFIDEHVPLSNQLSNKVKRALLTDSKTRVARFRDAGSIDMKRLPDIARLTDIQNVYQNVTHGKALNACVQIYIDTSGSMLDPVYNADGKNAGQLMQIAAGAAAVLSNTFDYLRIPHQLICYESHTRVIKNWGSRWKDTRLADVEPIGGTNIPRALSSAIHLMQARREKRKIAIVLTDGDMSSYDSFYHVGGELETMKRKGVEVYAIGLGVRVVCSDPNNPSIDYNNCVGVGDRVQRYRSKQEYELGSKPISTTVGVNGGIDCVTGDTLLPKLSQHLVHVFTEGRQIVR